MVGGSEGFPGGNGVGSAAGDGSDDEEGLRAASDGGGQRGVEGIVGKIPAAGVEAEHGAADAGMGDADGAAEGRVRGLEGIEDGGQGDRRRHLEGNLFAGAGEEAEGVRKDDTDHGRVWTSMERTGGRWLATAVQ